MTEYLNSPCRISVEEIYRFADQFLWSLTEKGIGVSDQRSIASVLLLRLGMAANTSGSITKSIHMEQADKVLDYVKKHCCETVDLSEFCGPDVVAFKFSTDMKAEEMK